MGQYSDSLWEIIHFIASPGIIGNVFSQGISQLDTFVTFTHISAMNDRWNKVSKFAYQICQLTMHPGEAFSCTIPRSVDNSLPEM